MDGAEQFLTRLRLSLQRYNFPPSWRPLSPRESYEYERMRRMANVAQALWLAKNKLPSAVRRETGEALDEALSGIPRESFYISGVISLLLLAIYLSSRKNEKCMAMPWAFKNLHPRALLSTKRNCCGRVETDTMLNSAIKKGERE